MRDIAFGKQLSIDATLEVGQALATLGIEFAAHPDSDDLTEQAGLVFVGVPPKKHVADNRGHYLVGCLPNADFDLAINFMRAGVRDVCVAPIDVSQVRAVIGRQDQWLEAGRNSDNLRPLADVEKDAIEFALQVCRGQMSMVARRLGIGRSTLYRKVEQYGIRASVRS